MKRMVMVVGIVLMMASIAWAEPWLYSNSVPAGSWDTIGVKIDSAAEVFVTPQVNADGTIRLWYDLSGISIGNHTVALRGKKGVWYSPVPFVYTFTRPNVASVSGVGLSE